MLVAVMSMVASVVVAVMSGTVEAALAAVVALAVVVPPLVGIATVTVSVHLTLVCSIPVLVLQIITKKRCLMPDINKPAFNAVHVIMVRTVQLDQLMYLSAKKNLVSLAVVTVNVHLDHVAQHLVIRRRSTVARVIVLSAIPVEIAICVPQIITKKTINALHVLLV